MEILVVFAVVVVGLCVVHILEGYAVKKDEEYLMKEDTCSNHTWVTNKDEVLQCEECGYIASE